MNEKKISYYWDSCMFYEYLNSEKVSPTKKKAVLEILQENKNGNNIIVTSSISDLEVIPEKLNDLNKEVLYTSQFDGVHMISVPIEPNILRLAREIRNFYYRPQPESTSTEPKYAKMMDLGDSIHLATAAIHRVSAFHTRDDNGEKTKIPLLSLYKWSKVPLLVGRYNLTIESPESDEPSLFDDQKPA